MPPDLTDKQRKLLEYIADAVAEAGRAPSLRQAAAHFGVSHAAINQQIKALEEKGFIRRDGRYSRRIEIVDGPDGAGGVARGREIPIVGRIAAGLPLYAQQEWDGTLVVDATMYRAVNLFALRVRGDSMIEAGIMDGDLVICEPRQFAQNGEIVVALLDQEEATVKRFYLHPDRVELRPENRRLKPRFYEFSRVLVQGKVIGLQRDPDQVARLYRLEEVDPRRRRPH
jgi:repressor LexA